MSDGIHTGMEFTDMTSFLEHHERRSRHVFVAMLCASLAVAAVTFGYGVGAAGKPGAVLGDQWLSILFYPLLIGAFWALVANSERKRPKPPGGRHLMNPDDARNTARVANAGYVFVACLGVVLVVSQASFALNHFFGFMGPSGNGLGWLGRAIVAAGGLLTAYFGNAWSRMPTPRQPALKPATQLKFKRLFSWLMVVHGLLLALVSLLLPFQLMIGGVLALCVSMVLSIFGSIFMFRSALKSPSAA